MSKRAIILAGGKGTRLRPFTLVLPKPLVPIGERPILEIIIRQLANFGFDHITMAVNHQADLIKAFFGDGSKWNVRIDYSLETKPLSTMGPLTLIPDLPENFLIMNGDVLTDLDLSLFFQEHVKEERLFTVASCCRETCSDYGVLEIDSKLFLKGFFEKPTVKHWVSMGIYMMNRHVLECIPKDKPYGFDNLMFDLLKRETPVKVKPYQGKWLDIGRSEDYARAVEVFEEHKDRFLPEEQIVSISSESNC